MSGTRDIESYDPKSLDNPINQEKGEKPNPVTEQELGFLEYGDKSPNNPKNQPQRVESQPEKEK